MIYTSIDQPIAAPILGEFERQTGIRVRAVYDGEATKTVGLAERLRAEHANPQADVWWGNEPFHTIRLADEGLLQSFDSPSVADIPAQFRDAAKRWAGVGLRARVIVSSDPLANVRTLEDLTRPQLRGRVGIARPTAGTTASHMAALWTTWGEARTVAFLRALRDNDVKLLGGNSAVAQEVANGSLAAGLTDNDDVANINASAGGRQVTMALPDQDGAGMLSLPTTVGWVAGSRRGDAARRLIDYLLSPGVEKALIDAKFAGWSVRDGASAVKSMQVNYADVANAMPNATRRAMAILEGRE